MSVTCGDDSGVATRRGWIRVSLPALKGRPKVIRRYAAKRTTTAELLLEGEVEPDQLAVESSCKTNLDQNSTNIDSIVTPRDVQLWLAKNISKLFGEEVRVPNELFLTKIANELNTYEISLPKLEEIVKNEGVVQSYQNLLRGNNLAFLPLYQQILCMILLYLDRDIRKVVDRLNSELMLLGIRLHVVQSGT
jgi:hypothetical protein